MNKKNQSESSEQVIDTLQKEFDSYKYHLPGAMIEVNLDINNPQVTFMNRIARILFGYDEDDLEDGLMFWEMVQSEEEYRRVLQLCISYFGESVLEGKPYQRSDKQELFEMQMKRKDGASFNAEVQASVIMDEENIPHKLVAVFRDISRRKLLEKDRERLIQELQGAL
ncbi:MAG: hypothetical protein MAGBODY4_00714 [Candidatus Marinimicrobia bacterium]|nr:hypothetical protein [Candidatus Neomarinimicrobiota bacterium]